MKINLELNELKRFNKHFQFCVGSGHAPLALRKDYHDQLKFVHDTLGIQRVRFHGIFSDDMNVVNKFSDILPVMGSEKYIEYNFTSIGDAYENVLSTGVKPFVELSFMPRHLAKYPDQHVLFYYGPNSNSGMPKDDDEWMDFISQFINYLIKRFGKEEIETWYYEVWNEPDLIIFFGGSMEDYFHLYEITVKVIKNVDPNLKVGGPSTSGSKWINEFLDFVKKNNLPCDFISTHQYGGDPIGSIDGMNIEKQEEGEWDNPFTKPDILKGVEGSLLNCQRHVFSDKSETTEMRSDTIIENSRQVKNVVKDKPVYYTEWNENAIFSAYTNDTRKVGAFIILNALKAENYMDGSSVWCFSDIFEEYHQYQEEFHGGFGLISHHGILKPSYHALKFLHDAGDDRYVINDTYGDITLAAFKKNNKTQLILTRQNMKNLKCEKEEVTIDLNINASRVTFQRVDEDSGNPLKIYEEMGKPNTLSKAELESIKEKSKVISHDLPFVRTSNGIQLNVYLGINDYYFIEIE